MSGLAGNSGSGPPKLGRLAVIGAGKMAGALLRRWAETGVVRGGDIRIANRRLETAQALASEISATAFGDVRAAVSGADIVLLGVKPYQVTDVLGAVSDALPSSCLLLSVAAGVPLAALEAISPLPIIRVMPNTPSLVGAGAAAFCRGAKATDEHAQIATTLFEAVGVVAEVSEAQIDAVIGVSGSGVAYFYLLIEALTDGGVRVGLPRDTARAFAAQTALGAARMILETGQHPAELKDAVTTPGGTTIAALHSLESSGVRGAMMDAVQAAFDRAREMAGGK